VPKADPHEPGGALYVPRDHQGAGRHDNPDLYGALYLSESPEGAVAELLARFRGVRELEERHLRRFGRPLALATVLLGEGAALVDLDDPRELERRRLRPSQVATRTRQVTQRQAAAIFADERQPAGMRWWSTLESSWIAVTLFDRTLGSAEIVDVHALGLGDEAVREASAFLGYR
jgi:RES domain